MKVLKKIIVTLLILILTLVGTITVINLYVTMSVRDLIVQEDEGRDFEADCIIVLGASVRADGTPSLMLRDRIEKSVEVFFDGNTDILLMSGDNGSKEYNEVEAMKTCAIEMGVPKEHIITDHAGFSTYESMYRLKEVFGAKKAIIITQRYHLYRALYIGKQLGIDVVGVATEDIEYTGQQDRDRREIMARVKDFFYVIFDVQPTYLGDKIPLLITK